MFPNVPPPTYNNLAEASAAYHREQLAPLAAELKAKREAEAGLVVVVEGEGGFRQEYLAEFRELAEQGAAPATIFGEPVRTADLGLSAAECGTAVYAGFDLASEADAAGIVFLKPDEQGGYAVVDAGEAMQGGAALASAELVGFAERHPEVKEWVVAQIRVETPDGILRRFDAGRKAEARFRQALEAVIADGRARRRVMPETPPEPLHPAPPAVKTAADGYGTNRRARRAARAEARRAARKGR